jgi:leucyl/phenylalanyl-tRNA--protein transferase
MSTPLSAVCRHRRRSHNEIGGAHRYNESVPRIEFPHPEDTGPEGVVAIGGDLNVETLRTAYRRGIFPWPHEGLPLLWFCPPERAILDFDTLHIPERLARRRRNTRLRFTVDHAFDDVIAACQSSPRAGQDGTWITGGMLRSYRLLHRLGDAHSVEAWNEDGALVGGLYGVTTGGVFSGESMFHRETDASKLCVLALVDHLKTRGATWIDIQTMTPHFALLGAHEIPRRQFLDRLATEQTAARLLF